MQTSARMLRSLIAKPVHRCPLQSVRSALFPTFAPLRAFATASSPSTAPVSWVLTTAGPDRSGIVHRLARLVHEDLSANIEESRMARLGADFAVILHITAPAEVNEDKLKNVVQSAFPEFLVAARRTSHVPAPSAEREYHVMCEGPDQQGVVQALTGAFVKHGANIRDLSTEVHSAAFAGYPVFELRCLISVPDTLEESQLRAAVDQFAEETGFDVWIESADHDAEGEGEGEEEQPR